MKILVTVANFGTGNDKYLSKVLEAYRSMKHDVDIVVFSNLKKEFGSNITSVQVDLRGKDPHTLPFAHKQIMADRRNDYDLFIYTEDDTVITEQNLDAFLEMCKVVAPNEIPGFLNTDIDPNGELHFCNMSSHWHWDPSSVVTRGGHQFAFFSNEHCASYVLTRDQLRRAIESGGFLVEPHQGRYNWACTASTDPYTQCGFRKLICLTRFDDFLIRHLPDKYAARSYGSSREMRKQVDALLRLHKDGKSHGLLFNPESKLLQCKWAKSYYEPADAGVLSLMPSRVRTVLSLGCGWGEAEGELVMRGVQVTAVPMDSIIAATAAERGIEIVEGNFETARQKLGSRRFDCLLMLNVLHLVPDPVKVLSSFGECVPGGGTIIATVPNTSEFVVRWKHLMGDPYLKTLGDYHASGVHLTSHRTLRDWFSRSNVHTDRIVDVVRPRWRRLGKLTAGVADAWLAEQLIVVGKPAATHSNAIAKSA